MQYFINKLYATLPSFLQGDPGEPGLNGVMVEQTNIQSFLMHNILDVMFKGSQITCTMWFKGRNGDHGVDGAKGDKGDVGEHGQKGDQVHRKTL